jgi:hypothetical protein
MSRTWHNDRSLFPLLACREQLRVKGLRLKQLESERAKHREGREALEAQVRNMGVELKTPMHAALQALCIDLAGCSCMCLYLVCMCACAWMLGEGGFFCQRVRQRRS